MVFDYKLSYIFLVEACEKKPSFVDKLVSIDQEVLWAPGQVGPFGKKENFLPLLGIRRRLLCQWKTAHDFSRPETVTGA